MTPTDRTPDAPLVPPPCHWCGGETTVRYNAIISMFDVICLGHECLASGPIRSDAFLAIAAYLEVGPKPKPVVKTPRKDGRPCPGCRRDISCKSTYCVHCGFGRTHGGKLIPIPEPESEKDDE